MWANFFRGRDGYISTHNWYSKMKVLVPLKPMEEFVVLAFSARGVE